MDPSELPHDFIAKPHLMDSKVMNVSIRNDNDDGFNLTGEFNTAVKPSFISNESNSFSDFFFRMELLNNE